MPRPTPWLMIVNDLPGAGKTTLARRLSTDLHLPVLHRDGVYESLFDALDCQAYGRPPLIGPASYRILHYFAGALLAVGQSLIVEGCFRFTDLATAEFLQLQHTNDFQPMQVQCKGDGRVFLERFLARTGTAERHVCHRDLEFVEQCQGVMLQGRLPNLGLEGRIGEIATTDVEAYDYEGLLVEIRSVGADRLTS